MIASLAIALSVPPAALANEDDEMLCTLCELLEEQADEIERKR